MKAKIKDSFSRLLAVTLAGSLVLSVVFAADIFYPTSANTAYAAESSAIGTSGYTTGVVSNGTTAISVNGEYNLGDGAHTNKNGTIKVKCLSISGTTAVMQTYGVSAGSWPGEGDLTSSYTTYWGNLVPAISGVTLPKGTSSSDITPSGAYNILVSAAGNYSSFGADYNYAWLGTPGGSSYAYDVGSNGNVNGSYYRSISYVLAPLFNLNLSKVNVSSNTITYASFTASTSITPSQSISSVIEGSTVDLADVITSVKYSDGDNAGHDAEYKISVDSGSVSGTSWTVPTGINKDKDITLTIKDTALELTASKTLTISPRDAGGVSVEKSSSFPEAVTVGDSIDLSNYITVTGIDSGNQSDGTISDYILSTVGDYGSFDGTVYTPANVSSTKKVTINVTPSGYPVSNEVTSSVDYSSLSASFEITVKPDTTGWTDRDELTDDLGFHKYTDPLTDITWNYRYNDAGYILYLYTEDDVSEIISDSHVLLVPSSINGVSVVGIGGGSKDGAIIPFIPTEGEKINNTWTSIYIPSSIKVINDGAFYKNGASADIVIPGNINQIGVEAFKESKIKSVKFNDASNLILNTESFADIPSLTDVAFRGNGITIKQRAFSNDTGLTVVDIPNNTKFRGERDQNNSFAFQGTTGLELIKIDTDTVYSNIFSANKNLKKVIFGKNVSRVHYDWSGTAVSNSDTLDDTVDRATYSLNGDTIFEMNKTSGGSPFGYKGSLNILGQSLDMNNATNTYNDTGDPVTAKIAYLEKHYRETEAIKTYAQGSASSISIVVEEDPSVNTAVTDIYSEEQTSIEAYYDGIIFTGKFLEKDKMSVYKMFDTVQDGSYESAEFYALRTNDADSFLAEVQASKENSDGEYIATHSEDIISMFESKDSVTVTSDDLDAGTVDIKVVVLLKDKDGEVLIDRENGGKIKAFSYPVAIPVKAYTAENDFLENYGSYQAVINRIDTLQNSATELASNVSNLNDQIAEKNESISALSSDISDLESDNEDLQAQISALNAEKAALVNDKTALSSELTSLRSELADTISSFADLVGTTEIDSSDYTYSVTDLDSGEVTDYVLVNGAENVYDKNSASQVNLSDGSEVTVYTGTDELGNKFKFYVAEDGVHVVDIVDGNVVSDIVSSDTVSVLQHKIAAELSSIKGELDELKAILDEIAAELNKIGNLTNTDSDYSIDTSKSDSEVYNDILEVIKVLSNDIKELDSALTSSKSSLEGANRDNTKYYNAMVLIYNTLSDENLDTDEVPTIDQLITAVRDKAETTSTSLENAVKQNNVYAYQIEDRNYVLTDVGNLLSGGSASLVSSKISEIQGYVVDDSLSADEQAMYADQLAELNGYLTLIERVKTKLSALDKAQSDLDTANTNIESLEGQIDSLQNAVSSLQSTISSNETLISSLRDSVSSLTSENETQASTISSLEESVSSLESLSEEQSEQISNLSNTISTQKSKIDEGTATIDELSDAIATANSQIETLSSKNAELVAEISSLSGTIASLRESNTSQKNTIDSLSEQVSSLQSNNSSLSSQIASLRGTLDLSEAEVAELKSTVSSLQKNVSALQKENEDQASTISSLRADLVAANTLSDQYKMIVDTANTLLGLNLKNTDSKEDVENAIKAYIATAVSGDDTAISPASANYQAGYSAGVASVDVSKNSSTYKNGYSDGYAAGVSAGGFSSGQTGTGSGTTTDSSAILSLTSQISALTSTNSSLVAKNATLEAEKSLLESSNSKLSSENASLEKENKNLTSEVSSLEKENTSLEADNLALGKSNKTLTSSNKSLKSKNSDLSAANKSLKSENTSLQNQITALRNSSGSGSGSGGSSVVSPRSVATPAPTKSPGKVVSKTTPSPTPKATEKVVPSQATEEPEKFGGGEEDSGTKFISGTTVSLVDPGAAASVPASDQEAEGNLVKLTAGGSLPEFDFGGAEVKESSDVQKENAYNIINYYLNHIQELGDLGSYDIKSVSGDSDYTVTADVLTSVDVIPSAEMVDAFGKGEKYDLNITSDSLEDGSLYFIVHESEERAGTYDVVLEAAENGSLSMEVQDLSPITISKISYSNLSVVDGGGVTAPIEASVEAQSEKNGMLNMLFIIFGVLAIGGVAAFLIFNKRKRRVTA